LLNGSGSAISISFRSGYADVRVSMREVPGYL
jgi:hypothetical protein